MKTKIFISFILWVSVGTLNAQESMQNTIPLIGSEAPSFTAETTNGVLHFPDDFGKQWKILLSHPRDFSPVCTDEILRLSQMQDTFKELNVELAVLSTDTKEMHRMWKESMEEVMARGGEIKEISFPIIEDFQARISKRYGMLHKPASTTRDVRGVFIIGPENRVEATWFYPMTIGRNLEEILRTIQALQTARTTDLYTPANWKPGRDLLVPYYPYSAEDLAENPDLVNEFYDIGSFLWYQKSLKK
jgi:peroxiredoxin 2/4